ncbi:MAG: LysR family transcriptional regulator [Lachnospiraceae bacterium]|uniref:LysR family transcriptional regulator n=1 Tax=Candidatus Enterocloster excrementigallinarum TaxID=2838558 RepID=A0A9D2TG46_9FIRM|nr:LysR family transcriptional regulator [Lachnospiraceae bacterium]HJC67811.1 LysR family transcriptional regulator [Candidatus Enterocloster excrementigallinarum]
MELKELEYLIAIAEEKSISKAAERLFMAQSSLSQSLHSMEAELGGTLFIRTSSGVRPTESGKIAIEVAQKMLLEYHQLKAKISDTEGLKTGKVTFGVSTFRGGYLLPKVVCDFKKLYPSVQVEIHEANSMALEQQLIEGRVDLALVVLPFAKLKADTRNLLKDEIVLVVPKDHPVCRRVKETEKDGVRHCYIDLEDTIEFEYILSDNDTILGDRARKVFAAKGLVPKVCNDNLTAPIAAAMARAGLGLAFTYRSCCEDKDGASYYSIGEEGIYVQLALANPPGRYRSKAAKALEEQLLRYFSQTPLQIYA